MAAPVCLRFVTRRGGLTDCRKPALRGDCCAEHLPRAIEVASAERDFAKAHYERSVAHLALLTGVPATPTAGQTPGAKGTER